MKAIPYILLGCLCVLRIDVSAQSTDSLPSTQFSYSFNHWFAVSLYRESRYILLEDSYAPGFSFDVEARVSPGFSWLATIGTIAHTGRGFYENLPIMVGGDRMETRTLVSERKVRRSYIGLGAQANLRIGRGNLSLGVIGTINVERLRDVVSVGDRQPLSHTAVLRYGSVWQTGGRAQFIYTHWVDQRLALRLGTYIDYVGGPVWGNYEDGDPPLYELKRLKYSEDYDPTVDRYGLPPEHLLNPGDPTSAIGGIGLTLGMIYKPTR